jgi:hypothetical protein
MKKGRANCAASSVLVEEEADVIRRRNQICIPIS